MWDHAHVTMYKPTVTPETLSDYILLYSILFSPSGTEVRLVCKGLFPYLESAWDIWWTVDGKTLDKHPDHRFSKTSRCNPLDRKASVLNFRWFISLKLLYQQFYINNGTSRESSLDSSKSFSISQIQALLNIQCLVHSPHQPCFQFLKLGHDSDLNHKNEDMKDVTAEA